MPHHNATHGMSKTPTYAVWRSMLARCHRASHKSYPNYGGRGIKVCDRWRESFEAFLEDMGEQPEGLTIERENNEGDYEPGNCRWATPKEQARNRRNNTLIEFRGERKTIHEWAEVVGIDLSTLKSRLLTGWSIEATLTTPPTRKAHTTPRILDYGGRSQTAAAWARETGIPGQTITARIDRFGWTVERALTTPIA